MNITIDTPELLKGYISKVKVRYIVKFWDTIKDEQIHLGNSDNFKIAYDLYTDYQQKYYLNKDYLLPKNISLDKKLNTFKFRITHKSKFNKIRTIHLYSAKSLQEVIEYRKQFIANLL